MSHAKTTKAIESMSCVRVDTEVIPVYRNETVSVVHVPQRRPRGLRAPRELPRAHRRHGRRFLRRPRRRVVLVVRRGDENGGVLFRVAPRVGRRVRLVRFSRRIRGIRETLRRRVRRGRLVYGDPAPARREYRGVARRRWLQHAQRKSSREAAATSEALVLHLVRRARKVD